MNFRSEHLGSARHGDLATPKAFASRELFPIAITITSTSTSQIKRKNE